MFFVSDFFNGVVRQAVFEWRLFSIVFCFGCRLSFSMVSSCDMDLNFEHLSLVIFLMGSLIIETI